jgi:hypothetical protein
MNGNQHEQWIIQITHNIPFFSFHINYDNISVYTVYILERLFLEGPREYIHSGLVLGLDWAPCQFSSILYVHIFLVYLGPPSSLLFVPTTHISDVYPPLTIRWLNTAIQVNNMGAWYLIYNGHICLALCLDCYVEILVSSIPLVYNGNRFLRFLY